jgi:hypothetical protein
MKWRGISCSIPERCPSPEGLRVHLAVQGSTDLIVIGRRADCLDTHGRHWVD